MGFTPEFDPLAAIESLLEIIMLAHAAIYTEHRRVADLGADDDESRRLLAESAQIVFDRAPAVSQRARELAAEWGATQLLDPQGASSALAAVETEAAGAERALRQLLHRQEEIADRLRTLIDESAG